MQEMIGRWRRNDQWEEAKEMKRAVIKQLLFYNYIKADVASIKKFLCTVSELTTCTCRVWYPTIALPKYLI